MSDPVRERLDPLRAVDRDPYCTGDLLQCPFVLPDPCGFPSNPPNFYLENRSVTIYSYAVTKREKLLEKARNSPGGLSFSDFETLLEQSGWKMKRQTGSHRFWKAPKGPVVPIQPDRGKAKAYQVKQFLRIMGNGNE